MSRIRKCVARQQPDGARTLSVEESDDPFATTPGSVGVAVQRSLLDARQVGHASATGSSPWCSLVGRIAEAHPAEPAFAPGTRIAALGPAHDLVVVETNSCIPLPANLDHVTAAYWALLHALLSIVRATPIELGDSVVIRGGGSCGRALAQLAKAAGAFVVGVDPLLRDAGSDGVTWVGEIAEVGSLLPHEGVDVAIDLSSAANEYAELFGTIRTGGRAVLADSPETTDLDLYPDVHRRSLSVRGFNLVSLCGTGRPATDGSFLRHLRETNRIALPEPTLSTRASELQSLPVSVRNDATSVMIEWENPDQKVSEPIDSQSH